MCSRLASPRSPFQDPGRVSIAAGWRPLQEDVGSPASRAPGSRRPHSGLNPHNSQGIQAPGSPLDPKKRSVKDASTSPGAAWITSPRPEDVGHAYFCPSLRPPEDFDSVSFPSRFQPHEASHSCSGLDAGSSPHLCGDDRRKATGAAAVLAGSQSACGGGARAGRGRGFRVLGPPPGPGQAPLHLPSSSSPMRSGGGEVWEPQRGPGSSLAIPPGPTWQKWGGGDVFNVLPSLMSRPRAF